MKTLYELLEMNEIQNQIKGFCASTLGKNKVDSFQIIRDQEELEEEFIKVDEAMKLIQAQGRVPLGGLSDLSMSLKKANRDGMLLPEELLMVMSHLECVSSVRHYICDSELAVDVLNELASGLVENKSLHDDIQRCVLPDGTISDGASSTLSGIRKRIRSMQLQIRHKMESYVKDAKDYLSIDQMTTKNDRLVLPVKTGYKGHFNGLVHAQSATGQTTYIEPESVVLMNNQLNDLHVEEKAEIERILFELSARVKENYYHFFFNLQILEELDFIFARGQYGVIHNCCIPTLTCEGGELVLKEARHPLIDEEKVIPNDIAFQNHKMVLITGSNTGGKTVTMKTTGLLSLMALSAIPIPCVKAVIPMFDEIYVDLGDEQSIEQSLSTFSSHMKKIIYILEHASSSSLVLIDEIGSGTDPQEGESIAEAVLNKFLDIGCNIMVSTHYGKLKTFASERNDILLASVSFDLETMRPTYKLKLESVGQSYAIEIAKMLGMSDEIIEQAKAIKESSMSEHEKLLEELQKQKDLLDQKQEELDQIILETRKQHKQYQHQIHQINQQKDKIIKEAHEQSNQLIQEAKEKIDKVVESMSATSMKPHIVLQAKRDLDDLRYVEKEEIIKQDHVLKVGDHVKLIKMNREGDIVEILKNHMVMVSLSGLNIKVHEDEVSFMHGPSKPQKVKKTSMKKANIKKTGSYEINIIGKRYEEAMAMVDKFLDDALVLGYPHVRIVHGMGTGVLRKGVRKMLEKNKHVVSYRDGGPNEGGLGATLVYFE